MNKLVTSFIFLIALSCAVNVSAQYLVYEDKLELDAFGKELAAESKEKLLTIIEDRQENPHKRAAAVNVLRENYFAQLAPDESWALQEKLRSTFRASGSSFIRIEIAYALCALDRARYFKDMVSFLIRRLDNENNVVSERAFGRAMRVLKENKPDKKEAKFILGCLNKVVIKEAKGEEEPDFRTKEKNELLKLVESYLN